MPLRDYSLTVLPPWLLDVYGSAWARAHGDTKDSLAALLKERVAARMPIRPGAREVAPHAPTGALDATGRDRLMPRAAGETDAGYAARLADAWTIHADGGTPRGALRALRAAGYPEAMLVIRSQRLYKLDADGELVVTTLPAGSWCFEPEPQPFWSRYAVVFHHSNLPPAWRTGAPVFSAMTEVINSGGSVEPFAEMTGGSLSFSPPATIRLEVVDGSPDYTFSWDLNGVNQQYGVNMFPGGLEVPVPLNLAGGAYSGVDVTWKEGDPYASGDAWQFTVLPAIQIPAEDSAEMNVIRTLTKEWSNAAAQFMGIFIITAGRALGWPLAPLGSGWTLGGSTVVKYHP